MVRDLLSREERRLEKELDTIPSLGGWGVQADRKRNVLVIAIEHERTKSIIERMCRDIRLRCRVEFEIIGEVRLE
ncbi:MAG: hypothetical protein AAB737_01050 [Patescibacteria group bacterium]